MDFEDSSGQVNSDGSQTKLESNPRTLPPIKTALTYVKPSSSKNLDHGADFNEIQGLSPSTGTGLLANKIGPITPSILSDNDKFTPSNRQGIYNLPAKFDTLQNSENVVEVFDLSKGIEKLTLNLISFF